MATPTHISTALAGAFVMTDPSNPTAPPVYSHSVSQIQNFQDQFRLAVAALKPSSMPDPDMCTIGRDKRDGILFRFYWFGILNIGGKTFGLGANLHKKGYCGSMWLMSEPKLGDLTPELHPNKPPQIPNKPLWQAQLLKLLNNGTFDKKRKK